MNLYGYVMNDPVNSVDVNGLRFKFADQAAYNYYKPLFRILFKSPEGRRIIFELMCSDKVTTLDLTGWGSYANNGWFSNSLHLNPNEKSDLPPFSRTLS